MMSVLILLLAGLSYGAVPQPHEEKKCPPENSLEHCNCAVAGAGASVTCQDVSESGLIKDLSKLKGLHLNKLLLKDVNASSIQDGLFEGWLVNKMDLEQVRVDDDSLRNGHNLFQSMENSLKSLEMKKMTISSIRLYHMAHLVVLIMEDNEIPSVDDDWFTGGPASLRNLYLARNRISSLGEYAFFSLAGLKHLDLSRNEIEILTRNMLPEAENKLTTLDLSRNRLEDMANDIFSGMPNLLEVDVSGNLLHTLREVIWRPIVKHVMSVGAEDNPLECDGLKWICEYDHLPEISGICHMVHEPEVEKGIKEYCLNPTQRTNV